ncbi:anaerobic ribonucleoside-triphosphate reductase activating protein [Robertmurraya sp. FSL R5-0851]|uniref:anaerobic ribonucleoside-triphosphate reductase activating protein n=1 Tax=Robertmurraya sp. FSL R5-0851 TaxID=2921584 RepID=UPI0030FA021D
MKIGGFYSDSISNGVGWRAVLFVSGCPHHCLGCHNQESWDKDYGEPYVEDDIYNQMMENPFLDGLTLSGGEPFLYCQELFSLVKRVKATGLNIWSYTGFTFEELLRWAERNADVQQFLQEVDVLVDGKFLIEKMIPKKRFRGSSNQRIIDVQASLKKQEVVLYMA